ncbi:MAG: endolytic transglycosylase MltG [Gemmatimonadota bacterium]
MREIRRRRRAALLALLAVAAGTGACAPSPPSEDTEAVDIVIPDGATFQAVADTLAAHGLINRPRTFAVYARLRGVDGKVKAGHYLIPPQASWGQLLHILTTGRVATVPLTIPEGLRLTQIAPRIAEVSGVSVDSVMKILAAPGADSVYGVPGPGLEGYLFPDTYHFARGVSPRSMIRTMVDRYHQVWTPGRRARLDSLGMSEREIVTLASIIQAEARRTAEMPLISSVYHNRLRRGWLLQADPTVLYALGGPRERLLYAAIDSVKDNPYNTYTQPGLPPGPIGSPGEKAIDAALHPAETNYMYFVARPGGHHVFTRTLAEHNRAKARARREFDSLRATGAGGGLTDGQR